MPDGERCVARTRAIRLLPVALIAMAACSGSNPPMSDGEMDAGTTDLAIPR